MPHSYFFYLTWTLVAPVAVALADRLFTCLTDVEIFPRCTGSFSDWEAPPETYPRRGPRFWYGLVMLSLAAYGAYRHNWPLTRAEITVWIVVMAPVWANALVVCWRMIRAFRNRWIVKEVDNPLLEIFARKNQQFLASLGGARGDIQNHSWGVPTQAGLKLIKHQGKIVEVGAGTGYWAWMMFQFGIDVVAYDISPGPTLRNSYHRFKFGWFPVRKRDAVQAALRNPDRTLMFCWPTNSVVFARALRSYKGERVIYIGANDESNGCFTGDVAFHHLLQKHWRLVCEEPIPCWGELKDCVRVYERVPVCA